MQCNSTTFGRIIFFTSVAATLTGVSCSGDSDRSAIENHATYADIIAELGGQLCAHLEFSHSEITDDDLADLEFADTVNSVSLSHTAITDRGVAELKRAKKLVQLELISTQITSSAVDELEQMPELYLVHVVSQNFDPKGYEKLGDFLGSRRTDKGNRVLNKAVPRLPVESSSSEPEPAQ